MKVYRRVVLAFVLAGTVSVASRARADGCTEYTEASSSAEGTPLEILDTDVGTEAYQRLLPYSSGGHKALGMAIAARFDYFGSCEYVGVGIGDGSGGKGFRPNYTLWLWKDGVDLVIARSAIYDLIGASSNPVVTNGDCAIACDGTYASTTTTTTQPVVVPVVVVEEPVMQPEPTTTTTEVVAIVANAVSSPVVTVPKTVKKIVKKKPKTWKVVKRRR